MTLSNDNRIEGVSSLPGFGLNLFDNLYTRDTSLHPLTLIAMNLFQTVERKEKLGRPFVKASRLSLSNDEVIISGTYNCMFEDKPCPGMLYYFRDKLKNISYIRSDEDKCTSIHVHPNPAHDFITITSDEPLLTYHTVPQLYNVIGQKIVEIPFDTKSISVDVREYPAGLYLLNVNNKLENCVIKIEKR